MEVKWADAAEEDMEEIIKRYICAGYDEYAFKCREIIKEKTRVLERFPNLGRKEEALRHKRAEYWYILESHFKILYRKEKNMIYIAGIFDTRQHPDKINAG